MECSICGKESQKLYRVDIEGAILESCENCLNFGQNLGEVKTIPVKKNIISSIPKKEEVETILIDNYGRLIIEVRQRMKITREEFAQRINEKLSVIKRVESEEMEPDDVLTKKIEKFLEIKLKRPYEEKPIEKKQTKGELTLGDIVELK